MLIVGLTGGIGSGKSAVAECFSELGTPIIDTDLIAHKLTLAGSPVLDSIIKTFGTGYLLENKQLNRKKLAQTIFTDVRKKTNLEDILHPQIRKIVKQQLLTYNSADYVIVVVPLLYESNFDELVDRVLVVDASEELQISRTIERDGKTYDEIKNIIKQQYPRQQRLHSADDIIYNSSTLASLRSDVLSLHSKYLALSQP